MNSAYIRTTATCLLFLLVEAVSGHELYSESDNPWAIGEAWSQDGKVMLYREYHYSDNSTNMPSRVIYTRNNGEVFAEKTINYEMSETAPAIDFTDFRTSTRISTEHLNGRAPGTIRVEFTPDGDSDTRGQDVDLTDQLIIDAGFDVFVRQNWDTLTGGNRVTAPFLVPSRMNTVRVGISSTVTGDCSALETTPIRIDEDIACFTVRPAGLLRVVGWLTEPIRLAYTADNQRLLMFDGISNIPDDSGEGQHVVLVFQYPIED